MGSGTNPSEFAGKHVHMIGIGGCGMSGAAAMLLELGASVSGSDASGFDGMGSLVARGARVAVGHRAEQLRDETGLVVMSAAIPESNVELAEARARGIPVLKYAELLGALMRYRIGVAVAGTHGKSTTTAMAAYLFRKAGLSPSFIFGADSPQLGGNSGVGTGQHLVVESCEFDRSFLHLAPRFATILNIEADHLDCYGSFDRLIEAFSDFAAQVDPSGLLLCNVEDEWAMKASESSRGTVESFGLVGDADWRATNLSCDRGRYAFDVQYRGASLLSTRLTIPGLYNVANALAAIALTHHAGGDPKAVAVALPGFAGVGRRMTWRGTGRGVDIVDDYAHHPTEVRLTIEAARYRYQPKRTWVVFQPHQYARTCQLMDEFAEAFGEADEIIVPDIYAAREPGAAAAAGSEELVSRICGNGGNARYLSTLAAAAEHVVRHAADGDLVVTMGAGDVWKVADELVERICGPDPAGRAVGADDVVSPRGTRTAPVSAA